MDSVYYVGESTRLPSQKYSATKIAMSGIIIHSKSESGNRCASRVLNHATSPSATMRIRFVNANVHPAKIKPRAGSSRQHAPQRPKEING